VRETLMVNSLQTVDRLATNDPRILQLPFVILHNVAWQTYQTLLADMGEHRSARLAFDRGTLEIKMPSKLHELINRLLERVVTTLTEELGMNILSFGSTTFSYETLEKGVEPDSCFYIQNADRVDPEDDAPPQDFPPDLVIEVDITSSSRSRLNIYKTIGVPEIWRYSPQGLAILQLRQDEYMECEYSSIFPMVSAEILREILEQGKQSKNHNTLIHKLRTSLRKH
jgi:Uma2 family endonuclease